jgi:hypothetical protein
MFRSWHNQTFAGFASDAEWTFSTNGGAGPQTDGVSGLSPLAGSSGVATSVVQISVRFTENVVRGSGNVVVRDQGGFESDQVFDVNATGNGLAGFGTRNVTIAVVLTAGKLYSVTFPAGAFRSVPPVLLPHPGITSETSWTFSTAGTFVPAIVAQVPQPSNLSVDWTTLSGLQLSFQQNVRIVGGVGVATIRDETGNQADQNVSVSSMQGNLTKTVTIPMSALPGRRYHVLVPAGMFVSLINQAFGGITASTAWNFVTTGGVAPTVVTYNPLREATGVNAATAVLELTFTENMRASSGGNVTIVDLTGVESARVMTIGGVSQLGTRTLRITSSPAIASGRFYQVFISPTLLRSFIDIDYAGLVSGGGGDTWRFRTSGAVAPTATLSPAPGSVVSAASAGSIVLSFSENVVRGSGGVIRVVDRTGLQATQEFGVTAGASGSGAVSGHGTRTIAIAISAEAGRAYSLEVPSTALISLMDVVYAGLTAAPNAVTPSAYMFYTSGASAPTVTGLSPVNNSFVNGGAGTTTLVLTFSQNVLAGLQSGDADAVVRVWDRTSVEADRVLRIGNVTGLGSAREQ